MSSPPEAHGRPATAAGALRAMFTGIPRAVWLLALAAAAFHMLPVWLASWNTPEGWVFTGNLSVSPDYMQYRLWMRQALDEGWIVSNGLTAEPTGRFLPVLFYWALGHVAAWGGWAPEFVYQYAGAALAGVLAILVFTLLRRFVPSGRTFWVAYGVIMLGGGVGGYLRFAERVPLLWSSRTAQVYLFEPVRLVPIFENYRQHYLVSVLVDTHFLLIWVLALLSVMAFLAGRGRGRVGWTLLTAALWGLTSVVHVYTGVTVAVIGLSVLALSARERGLDLREVLRVGVPCLAVGVAALWMLGVQRSSGFPMPDWREPLILPSTLVVGFPLQFALLVWGGAVVWRHRDDDVVLLAGWLLGCLLLTLGGPFYPYPSRGTMTMVVPLTALAALAWIRGGRRLSPVALAVVVLAAGSTTLWRLDVSRSVSTFRTDAPWSFLGPDHRQILDALHGASGEESVLMAPREDMLWLMPEFAGRPWVAHFFLSRDFERRAERLRDFFAGDAVELLRSGDAPDLLFVPADAPVRPVLDARPGWDVVVDNGVGALLRRSGAEGP